MNKEHIGSNFNDFLKEEGIFDICAEMQSQIIGNAITDNCFSFNGIEILKKTIKDCLEENERLKAENEKLKKEVSDLNFYIDNYKITWEIDKKEQYKQALEEVREIAIKKNYLSLDELLDDITNKINEVLKDA